MAHVVIDPAIAGQWISMLAGASAVAGWWHQRKKSIAAEGRAVSKIEQLVAKVDTQERKLSDLEIKAHCQDMESTEMKADIKYLVAAMQRIEERLDRVAPPTVRP